MDWPSRCLESDVADSARCNTLVLFATVIQLGWCPPGLGWVHLVLVQLSLLVRQTFQIFLSVQADDGKYCSLNYTQFVWCGAVPDVFEAMCVLLVPAAVTSPGGLMKCELGRHLKHRDSVRGLFLDVKIHAAGLDWLYGTYTAHALFHTVRSNYGLSSSPTSLIAGIIDSLGANAISICNASQLPHLARCGWRNPLTTMKLWLPRGLGRPLRRPARQYRVSCSKRRTLATVASDSR